MRNRVGFLFLVAFFTVFGAGRSHDWSYITTDRSGWSYSADLLSVKVEPSQKVIRCRVMALNGGGGRVVDRWCLDIEQQRLTRDSTGVTEPILPGSVAERAIFFFRERGDLPASNGLPVSRSEALR